MQGTISSNVRTGDRRILIVALILGAVAAGLAVAYLASQSSTAEVGGGVEVPVVVASRDIAAGETIPEDALEVRTLPVTAVIAQAASEVSQVIGETARYPIAQGAQVNSGQLVAPPTVQALSFQIPEGMRGFTIPVNESQSPAGLLAPGDFVDVLVAGEARTLLTPSALTRPVAIVTPFGTFVPSDGSAGARELVRADALIEVNSSIPIAAVSPEAKAVVTLLQNVQVLSVQRSFVPNGVPYDPSVRAAPPEGSVSYVTLALDPEQSQLLWLASQDGQITLTLRAFGENDARELRPVAGPLQVQ